MKNYIINFYDIKFYNYSFKKTFQKIDKGGYLVAPAASSLSKILQNKTYYKSLKNSNIAILDSGFFCILLRIFKKKKVKKLSGYLFLKSFLNLKFKKKVKFLNIDPNKEESIINYNYFVKTKKIVNVISYCAPKYNKTIYDIKLINLIKKEKPKYVIINIGGEVQEILAEYISNKINYKICIICTGAAIAFLTKKQAPLMNDIIDKFYLGWFVRLLHNPRKYYSRIVSSIYLIKLFLSERKNKIVKR